MYVYCSNYQEYNKSVFLSPTLSPEKKKSGGRELELDEIYDGEGDNRAFEQVFHIEYTFR